MSTAIPWLLLLFASGSFHDRILPSWCLGDGSRCPFAREDSYLPAQHHYLEDRIEEVRVKCLLNAYLRSHTFHKMFVVPPPSDWSVLTPHPSLHPLGLTVTNYPSTLVHHHIRLPAPTCPATYSCICQSVHLCIIHPSTHPLIHSYICPFAHPAIHPSIYSFIHTSVCLSVYPSMHSPSYPPVMYGCTHQLMNSPVPHHIHSPSSPIRSSAQPSTQPLNSCFVYLTVRICSPSHPSPRFIHLPSPHPSRVSLLFRCPIISSSGPQF